MIELDDYRIFVAVAREASFVAASRKTNVPTSTVSRAIARLESNLGVGLLHRTSRRVSLSTDGERLLARVGPLIDGLSTVIAEAHDQTTQPEGTLRVTAPVVSGSGWVGRSLASFAEAHPRVQVELRVTNVVVDLVRERFDLAFRGGPVKDERLIGRRIWSAPNVLVASPSFVERALGGRRFLTRAQLESLPAVVHAPHARWSFESGEQLRPTARFVVDDPRVAVEAAAQGLGIARVAQNLVRNDVVTLEAELGPLVAGVLHAVRPPGRAPHRVRLAIDWVARHAPSTLPMNGG